MPYPLRLEIEVRFYSLYCAYSLISEFSHVTDGIATFKVANNVFVLFFLLFNGLYTSNLTAKFPTTLNV